MFFLHHVRSRVALLYFEAHKKFSQFVQSVLDQDPNNVEECNFPRKTIRTATPP